MGSALKTLTLRGFKSIEALDNFALGSLTVLIGANGAGKSNFVDFFRLLRAMADGVLVQFVESSGGADGFFFLGPKNTPQIAAHLEFGENVYEFDLQPTADGRLLIADERVQYTGGNKMGELHSLGKGSRESCLPARKDDPATFGRGRGVPHYVYESVSSWTVYHFHDTSMLAPLRREQSVHDNHQLRPDASNLAAYLLELQRSRPGNYALIRDTIRLVAPFFDEFWLEAKEKGGEEKVRLQWRQKGSDYPFQPHQLSDGTLRFMCLATSLLQPALPASMVIDEPELGLHPYALSVLSDLIQSAAERTQVIISTQSATLLDHFSAEQVVVVNRRDARSVFEQLNSTALAEWLAEYSVGELWQKNVVQAGPSHE
jgi:predicted ATPase